MGAGTSRLDLGMVDPLKPGQLGRTLDLESTASGKDVILPGKADYGPVRVGDAGVWERRHRWGARHVTEERDGIGIAGAARVDGVFDRDDDDVAGVNVGGDLDGHIVGALAAE